MDAAVVLAGGASTRMGRDKAWLELDGQPLLVRVIDVLAARCRPIVIAARAGQRLPDPSGRTPALVERVDDPQQPNGEAGGPLVAVIAGLEHLAAGGVERAYLGCCDAAALSVEHVAFMLDALARWPSIFAVVPSDAQGLHPLASAVRVDAMLARATAQRSRGQLRLQALFEGPGIVGIPAVELPDPRALAPCNTPAQWRALRRDREPAGQR